MASNIRTVTNASWIVAEVLLSLFPGYGIPSSICLSLARNSTFNNDVIYAADHDMRVKVTITDSKNNHTSYSTQVTYQVVY